MNNEILNLLKEIGLSPSQSMVYLSLLGVTKSVKDLELELKLGRSTIVEALLFLEDLNLLISSKVVGSSKKQYQTTGLNNLNLLIENKISNLNTVQEQLEESRQKIGKFIKIFGNPSSFDTTTQIFIGKKEISNLYRSTINIEKIYSICRLDDYYRLFPGGLSIQSQANRLNKRRIFKDLIIKGTAVEHLLNNRNKVDYSNYSFKLIDDSELLRESAFSDILICDSYTIFSNFKGPQPYSIRLNSAEISKFLIYFHSIVWGSV